MSLNLNEFCDPNGKREVYEALRKLWAEPEKFSVSEWVENNMELPTGQTTGRVNLDEMPYAREILEASIDRTLRHLVMCFATQSGKTSTLMEIMLNRIVNDPEDCMFIMGNDDQARGFNKERLMPAVRLCKAVMDLVPKTTTGAIDKNLWGFKNQHYKTMVVNFVGAGSPTNLASRPRGLIICDEIDKYYTELRFDAGSLALAEERQKSFHFPLCIKSSSPTLAERMIWQEYLQTDQRQFWVPCPRCGDHILFRFKIKSEKHGDCGVRWWHEHPDEAKTEGEWDFQKIRALAHYKCQSCGGMIHDFERPDSVRAGIWKPANMRADPKRRGYHINSIYSLLGNETSLGGIACKWIIAKHGMIKDLQNFVNGWLAEPWDEMMRYEDMDQVKLTVFNPDAIPVDTVTLAGIDVQEGHFWMVVRKFAKPTAEFPHGQSWLLYADRVEAVETLENLLDDFGVNPQNVLVDMAHRPNATGKMILDQGWMGVWGTDTKEFYHPGPMGTRFSRIYSVTQWRDPLLGTAWENRTFKRVPYVKFSKNGVLDVVSSLRHADPPIWHATVNANPAYPRHLNSRIKQQQKNKRTGRVEWVWHELTQQNHLADCENFVTVRALTLGLLSLLPETDKGAEFAV